MKSFHSYFVFPLTFGSSQYCRYSWNISSYYTLTRVISLIYAYKKIVIERTRDLIYLKFLATDFSPKIIKPSTGENSGDSA